MSTRPQERRKRQGERKPVTPAAAPRDEGGRRADRDGHRLRPSLGAGRRGGRRGHGPGRRLRRDDRPRLRLDRAGRHGRDAHARRRGAPRPAHAVPDRRHALRLVRALGRPGGRERAAVRQGGRVRRREARARRLVRRPREGDRQRGHPGHGPRGPDAADGDPARRLQGAGQDGRARRADRRRGARASGGRLLRDRVRGRAGRVHRGDHEPHGDPRDRHRRRARHGRPGPGLPRPARHLRRSRGEVRQALRKRPRGDDLGSRRVRGRGALGRLPGAGAHLRDRARRSSPSSAPTSARSAIRRRAAARSATRTGTGARRPPICRGFCGNRSLCRG